MGRLTWFGFGSLCLLLSLEMLGCSSGSPANGTDGGVDMAPVDVRVDAEPDTRMDVAGGGVDVPDDVPPKTAIRLVLSEKTLKLSEGSTASSTFTVMLTQTSPSPFIVTVLTANPNVATVVPETLEFAANEIGPKLVTVVPTTDDDTVDNNTVVTLSSPETGSASVAIEVKDSDMQTLIVATKVAMTEGRTESLNVRLFKRPASSVVVTLTSSNPSKLMIGATTATMTFNATNYSIPQMATLTAAQDDDTTLDNVTVNLTATGNVSGASVAVEITDDDAVNLDISPASLSLMERATTPGTIMVRLTRPPSADVIVAVASSSTMKATVSPATLTFTAMNYATAQNVLVTPVADDDSRDETVNVTFTATGVTPAPPVRIVAVAIDDPDSQALQVMPNTLSVTEGGTVTFDVRLTLNPGSSSTVNVFSQNPAKLDVSPPVLTFTTGNFSSPQTVTVKSLHDEDLANDSVMVTLTGSAADNVSVPVAVTDDDMQAIQFVGPSPGSNLVMQETQASGPPSTSQVGVRLAFRPSSNVTVLLTSGNASKLELSRSSLTFSPANYASVQFLTVTAPHDVDMVDDVVELSATAVGTGIPLAKLSVEIRDMDVLAFDIFSPPTPPTIVEGRSIDEGTSSFVLKLTVVPETAVSPVIEVTAGHATISSSACQLTGASAMSTGCTVTVRATQDDDIRDESVTVTISDPSGRIATRTVGLMVDDQDTQGLVVAAPPGGLIVTEQAGTDNAKTFTVRLASDAITPTTINLTPSLPGQVTVTPSSFEITSAGARPWNVEQTITVAGIDDLDLLEQNPSIRISAVGLGVPDAFVNVRKTDNDIQALVFTNCSNDPNVDLGASRISLTEPAAPGAGPATMCVKLAFQPEVTNTVTLTPSQMPLPLGLTAPNFEVSPTTLTFNNTTGGTGSYDNPQLITVTPIPDQNIDNENDLAPNTWDSRITVSVTPFANPRTFKVAMSDRDHQSFLFGSSASPTAPSPIELQERTQAPPLMDMDISKPFAIRLARIPLKAMTNDPGSSETITITPSSSKVTVTAACSGAPLSLSFTNATWMTPQTVTVTSCPDDGTRDETVTLTIHSDKTPGADQTITVHVDDRDVPYVLGVAVTGNGGTVSAAADSNGDGISSCTVGSGMAACTGSYEPQATVTLTETHDDATWAFGGWSGCLSATGPSTSTSHTLNVLMSEAKACLASFLPRLAVTVGPGGSVRSAPPDTDILNCTSGTGGDCTEAYPVGTSVRLRETPSSGWELATWGGDCVMSGVNTADVTMSQPQTCTASFNPLLTVMFAGTGTGSVTAGAISCSSGTCPLPYNVPTTVTATAGAASTFAGWSPAGCGGSMTLTGPQTCTATFDPL